MAMMVTQVDVKGVRGWLDGGANHAISDAALGCILLATGIAPIWSACRAPAQSWTDFDADVFPALIGAAMWAIAALLLIRAAVFRGPSPPAWGVRAIAIVVAGIVVWVVFAWNWLPHLMLDFNPMDHAAAIVLILVSLVAVSAGRASRPPA